MSKLHVSVRFEERFTEAALNKGAGHLVFIAHPDKDKVLEKAADIAEQFDVEVYVDGRLWDPHDLRDFLAQR